MAATSDPGDRTGVNIMIAGLVLQVLSLAIFMVLGTDFALRVRKAPDSEFNLGLSELRQRRLFRIFPYGKSPVCGNAR